MYLSDALQARAKPKPINEEAIAEFRKKIGQGIPPEIIAAEFGRDLDHIVARMRLLSTM